MKGSLYRQDKQRYVEKMPKFQRYFRKASEADWAVTRMLYRVLFKLFKEINHVEINLGTEIGGGLYIRHPFCITINPDAKIGSNVNLHRGVLIGQENRGKRKGAPIIGDEVWIGINAAIVGKIVIGDDVLIAPNSYVNCNVPSHSIVIGNPCRIIHKDNATENYVNHQCINV